MSKYTESMKTKSGYNYKIILASALFIVLTAVKLLFPAQTEGLRSCLREAVSRDADYSAVFETIGERLSDGAGEAAALLFGQTERSAARIGFYAIAPFSSFDTIICNRADSLPENLPEQFVLV